MILTRRRPEMAESSDISDKSTASDSTAWTEADSATFVETGNAFTPERERQHEIICNLIAETAPEGRVVELCCGAGDLARTLLDRLPAIHLQAYDGSATMRDRTRANCASHGSRIEIKHFDLASSDWRPVEPNPDVVYSSLAIHHLDGFEKQSLYRDVLAMLQPGGLFIMADLVRPAAPSGFRVAAETWRAEVAARSQTIHGDDRAVRKFDDLQWNYYVYPDAEPGDMPSTIVEHLAWLELAGFAAIDLHWMVAGHVIVSGKKPESSSGS